MANFADRIKLFMTMNGLTQDDIAIRLGTNKQTVSRYETGQQIPRLDVAMEIAKKLNVEVFWLIGIDDIDKTPEDGMKKKLCDLIQEMPEDKVSPVFALANEMSEKNKVV